MTDTTGNFQDLLQFSADTLYCLGEDFVVGNSLASTVTYAYSNSAGVLDVVAAPTGNQTLWMPSGNGTLLSNVNFSAGTTSNLLSAVTFSNSNGVSFGLNGSVLTASVNAGAGGGIAAAAGTQTATSGTIVFSNSPSVSFGMSNSSVVTASAYLNAGAGDSLGVSSTYGTASIIFFANTHITPEPGSVSFGITSGANAVTITASVATSLQYFQVNDSVQDLFLGTLNVSNSNGVSFGLSNLGASDGQLTASCAVTVSAGASTAGLNAVTFSNSNGVSFGLSAGTITASVAGGGISAINVSAGTTSNNLSAITFSNSNGVSFGLNGSTITGSHAINVSAGTTSNNLSAITFSNSNGIEFGLNGSVVTAALGGFSNWVNGAPVTTFGSSQAVVSFQPILIDQAITITNVMFLGSLSQGTASSASSGGYNASVGLYTLNGAGTSGSFSLASSASTFVSWTSGAPYSSVSGVGYRQMSVASWAVTAGPYMLAVAFASSVLSSISMTLYGTASILAIGASGQGTAMSSMPWLPGYSQTSVAALPVSFGVSNTASFIRTGATAWAQPWASFQGT